MKKFIFFSNLLLAPITFQSEGFDINEIIAKWKEGAEVLDLSLKPGQGDIFLNLSARNIVSLYGIELINNKEGVRIEADKIDFSGNRIETLAYLNSFRSSIIRHLNFSNNRISSVSIDLLKKSFRGMPSLESVDLRSNYITNKRELKITFGEKVFLD